MAQIKKQKERHLEQRLQQLKWQLQNINIRRPARGTLSKIYALSTKAPAIRLTDSFNTYQKRKLQGMIRYVERQLFSPENFAYATA